MKTISITKETVYVAIALITGLDLKSFGWPMLDSKLFIEEDGQRATVSAAVCLKVEALGHSAALELLAKELSCKIHECNGSTWAECPENHAFLFIRDAYGEIDRVEYCKINQAAGITVTD